MYWPMKHQYRKMTGFQLEPFRGFDVDSIRSMFIVL